MFCVVFSHRLELVFSTSRDDQVNRTLDRDVQSVNLFHLFELPHLTLAMPPVAASLMAVLAQSHADILAVLLDVVRIAGWGRVTHGAGQLLDESHPCFFFFVERVVHGLPNIGSSHLGTYKSAAIKLFCGLLNEAEE